MSCAMRTYWKGSPPSLLGEIDEIGGPTIVDLDRCDFAVVVCSFLEDLACWARLNEVENGLSSDRKIASLSGLPELVGARVAELI